MSVRRPKRRKSDDGVDEAPPSRRPRLIKPDERLRPTPRYTPRVSGRRKSITVVVVEPQPLMLRALVGEIQNESDITVVGTAATGTEGCQLVHEHEPDVLLMAYPLADMTGPQIARSLRGSDTAIIALSSDHSDDIIFRAVVRGASGYILKSSNADIPGAIRRVANGHVVLCGDSLTTFVKVVRERAGSLMTGVSTGTPLTQRELEVLRLVCDGLSQRRIAEQMGLSAATTRTHTRNAYRKLGVSNKGEAIREAIRRGMVGR